MKQVSVYIACPSFIMRKGLKAIIDELPELKIIKETDNEHQLLGDLENMLPDILVADASFLSDKLANNLKFETHHSEIKLIAIVYNEFHVNGKFPSAVNLKFNMGKSEIIDLFKSQSGLAEKRESKKLKPWELSEREEMVVKNVALGLTNKEIADKMFLSPHTVITHRKNITKKLGIKSASGLTVYAMLNNIIDPEEIS